VQETWFETEIEVLGQALKLSPMAGWIYIRSAAERGMYIATPDWHSPGGRRHFIRPGRYWRASGRMADLVVGKKFEGVPPGEGKLYLRIEASPGAWCPAAATA